MLRNGLAIYCYTAPTLSGNIDPVINEYGQQAVSLSFTTLSPGGFGQLSCMVKLPNPTLPRPELQIFSRLVIMDGNNCVWIGEIMDPEMGMTEQDGTYVNINALGIGNCLRDDPVSSTYTNQTAKQIINNQFTLGTRANALIIDSDQSACFPDAPGTTYSPAYTNKTMEEVVADVATLAGDYSWGTWAHPVNRDKVGFPTGQLQIHSRDTSTTHYTAYLSLGDITEYHVTPSAERAYNIVEVDYQQGGYGSWSFGDPRLGAGGLQGTAPFRRRKYLRDLSGISTVTASQAQSIATTYGGQFENITNKVSLKLRRIRDANGQEIPPWQVRADRNIFVPELAVRGTQIANKAIAGTNQFYILQTSYTEQSTGDFDLQLDCDNFSDRAGVTVARLQTLADAQQRSHNTTGTVQQAGAAETGFCGVEFQAANANDFGGQGVNFKTIMVNAPTSITFSSTSNTNIGAGPTAANITIYGFRMFVQSAAGGAAYWVGTYQTNGNCLLAVDAHGKTYDWHCDGCKRVWQQRSLQTIMVDTSRGHQPGVAGLSCKCQCGTVECFNTGLTLADTVDDGRNSFRAQQARLIRAAMQSLGLAVG